MALSIRRNFALKVLSLFLAIIGWAYFRFANNPVISARFDQQLSVPITAANLPPGYIAKFPDKTAIVTVAPKHGEPPIKPDEIKAVLDLSNRTAGVYNVPVQLVAPSVVVQSLSPASVTLTVTKIDARSFPVAMYYGGQANVVVSKFSVTPANVTVRGPSDELAQIATVRVDMPLSTVQPSLNSMIRPVPVNSAGEEIHDVQVVPNLVRVQAEFQRASGPTHSP
jgi:YbbR domain-containing protein